MDLRRIQMPIRAWNIIAHRSFKCLIPTKSKGGIKETGALICFVVHRNVESKWTIGTRIVKKTDPYHVYDNLIHQIGSACIWLIMWSRAMVSSIRILPLSIIHFRLVLSLWDIWWRRPSTSPTLSLPIIVSMYNKLIVIISFNHRSYS